MSQELIEAGKPGLPDRLDAISTMLTTAQNDLEVLHARDMAKAIEAAAKVLERRDIQVHAAELVFVAEQMIVEANPPKTRQESGAQKGKKVVPPGNDLLKPSTLRKMRHAFSNITPGDFASLKAEARAEGEPLTRKKLIDHGKRNARKSREADSKRRREERESRAPDTVMSLRTCEIAKLSVPEGTLDAIITDPPYGKDALHLWKELGMFAGLTLKPGGVLVALSGHMYLPDVFRELDNASKFGGVESRDISYRWTCAYVMPGASTMAHKRNMHVNWKPLLVYTKGKEHGRFVSDLFTVPSRREQEADLHKWQQQAEGWQMVVDRFASPGDLIADPFLGGGTTAICARERGCGFIGADINPKCVETTQRRLT